MSKPDARSWLTAMVACGIGYLAISLITAALGARAPMSQTRAWRLAAWLASAVVFGAHIVLERWHRRSSARLTATRAALGAALGAFGLGAAAVLHALTSGEGNLSRLGVALIIWPVMTAVPAFLVALVVATPLTPRSSLPDSTGR